LLDETDIIRATSKFNIDAMTEMNIKRWGGIFQAILIVVTSAAWAADAPPAETHDGLRLVPKSKADLAYVRPEADFSVYTKVMIVEPAVAFRKNWDRDYNREHSGSDRVRENDMERIKTGMAELFLEVFTEELEKGGYPVVEEAADDVLLLRPAIVDLDVTAPDLRSPGMTRTYVTNAGSATLYMEFYDSVSSQILARVVDRKQATDWGTFRWATAASNRQEARQLIRSWSTMLIERLDEVHGK
jgi:Protein of unknown function (DUF3313)